ncbi:MAG TPA: SCO1664 family protein [Herpetosiphonaceae bacterium]
MSDQPEELPRPQAVPVDRATLLDLMRCGELELQGVMPWSSNYTFLCTAQDAERKLAAYLIYKPQKGERPLWDFPRGTLYKREAAAFVVSDALGWELVPPTIVRDGPHGVGSVQLFIDADQEQHYFTLKDTYPEQFQRMALFDALINNADRKGGHVLADDAGHVWAIDHGIAFHDEYKLRTVIWDWVGQPIDDEWLADLKQLRDRLDPDEPLSAELKELLFPREIEAMRQRLDRLIKAKKFPGPAGNRSMPWPPV